ncbi:MAG TPA: hypothetical protein PLF26_03670 [Blastocatellia bacterium]|nr:hypothetical protein [Blastocatellia bacterium]
MESNASPVRVRLSDALFTTIRAAVETDASHQRRIILYTSFGVVRGTVSAAAFGETNRMADTRLENTSRVVIDPDVIELEQCTVEHSSNHLPTGMFDRLFVRVDDVRGFAIDDGSGGWQKDRAADSR